ncbi:hypothetical protein K8Q98_00245 [Candidatus Nomurabacteria bacterium]|nr:hypothetical protein [Candidatus Nomurabacteria bacterium]
MQELSKKESDLGVVFSGKTVHRVLAHSYGLYFLLFLLGFFLSLAFPIKILSSAITRPSGFILLVLASILIFWAQHTSRNLDKKDELKKESFCRGPYRYTRSPTHLGLFLLFFGFGVLINSFFIMLTTLVSFFVTKFIFVNKQEAILTEKYGAPYLEYKKAVKF